MDVLKLLQEQSAQNRANFAQAQSDRAEAAATKPQQWTAQGLDADSGRMAIAANGDAPKLVGDRITSGNIKPGQAVRVNAAGGLVTVDQKPFKQKQMQPEQLQSTTQPYWIAFGAGFAVSFDAEAQTFTEAQQYPEYEEYSDSVQGDRMFPGGEIKHFAASDTLWVVGGSIGFNLSSSHSSTIRLAFAVSSDQGQTWQACEQLSESTALSIVNTIVISLVWGQGYFWALLYSDHARYQGLSVYYQVYRSADGLVWEAIDDIETPVFSFTFNRAAFDQLAAPSLAVWEGNIYLLQSVQGYVPGAHILKEAVIHVYTESEQGEPGFKVSSRVPLDAQSQYGAYDYGFYGTAHEYGQNWLELPVSLYPLLLSSETAIADYGNGYYFPAGKARYLDLIFAGANATQAIAFGAHIEGQTFLMVAERWGFENDDKNIPFGFAAIHEGTSWRTCEHPFVNTLPNEGNHDSSVQCVTYSATLQRWLVYETRSYLALSSMNGDDWSEPVLPELVTTLTRQAHDQFGVLTAIANQIRAYTVTGNYVS